MSNVPGALWVFAAVVALVAVLESGVRLRYGAPRPDRLPMIRVAPDPQLGYRPLPCDEHFGYDQPVRLNRLGMRGEDVGSKKPGEYRILALGDTQLYGLGVADGQLLSRVLQEGLMAGAIDRRYRVINLGVRGYRTNQQLELLKIEGLALQPDHVLVLFYHYAFHDLDIRDYYDHYRHYDWYMFDPKKSS